MKKLVKNKFLLIFLSIITFSFYWITSWKILNNSQKVKGITTNLSSSEIISLTNFERKQNSLLPLKPNEALSKAAINKAKNMFEKGYFDHLDSDGNGSWRLIEDEGYIYLHAGENLARNFNSADLLIKAWMDSESHRNNILSSNYSDIGVAVIQKEDQVYIVQILATPLPEGVYKISNSKDDFSFSTPISGDINTNYNLKLSILSFIISLGMFLISYKFISIVFHQYTKYKKPDIKYWIQK